MDPDTGELVAVVLKGLSCGFYVVDSLQPGDVSTPVPWLNKTCKDCPFLTAHGWCQVHTTLQRPETHTCRYFDPCNRVEALRIITERNVRLITERAWGNYRWFDSGGLS